MEIKGPLEKRTLTWKENGKEEVKGAVLNVSFHEFCFRKQCLELQCLYSASFGLVM